MDINNKGRYSKEIDQIATALAIIVVDLLGKDLALKVFGNERDHD